MTFREELEQLLEKELVALKELKVLAYGKTDIIMNSQIQELEATTKREEELVNEIGLLETEREKLLNSWGVASNIVISEIIEKIPGSKGQLEDIKTQMEETIKALAERNALNNELLNENLQWIDFNINLLTDSHGHPSYGKEENKGGKSFFDRKV